MIRISLTYIYNLAHQLDPLANLPFSDAEFREVFMPLITGLMAIRSLKDSIYYPYLRTCHQLGDRLEVLLDNEIKNQDTERKIDKYQLYAIRDAYNEFKITLLASIGTLDSYFVTQKGGFDTLALLAFGENLFPGELAAKVPEAISDARQAAKCLAYELPTAAGFHVFRATESVLRKYHSHVTGGGAPPKVRNIGVYLNSLKIMGKGDPKVRAALKQMTDLHRNPLVHPEAVLTLEEALAIFGIARSAMTVMLADLPAPPPTTNALSALLGATTP